MVSSELFFPLSPKYLKCLYTPVIQQLSEWSLLTLSGGVIYTYCGPCVSDQSGLLCLNINFQTQEHIIFCYAWKYSSIHKILKLQFEINNEYAIIYIGSHHVSIKTLKTDTHCKNMSIAILYLKLF